MDLTLALLIGLAAMIAVTAAIYPREQRLFKFRLRHSPAVKDMARENGHLSQDAGNITFKAEGD